MGTEPLEQAIATAKPVLAAVTRDQLGDPTPCANWNVGQLIDHLVGGQAFFTAGVAGTPPSGEVVYSDGDFVAAFDEASAACLAAFSGDGVMETVYELPFGKMPGAAFMGLATSDTFTHAWDLAKATGQSTDLDPALAAQLLEQSKTAISPAFRSEEGNIFGPQKQAPEGACAADQLAAFLGRTV